MMCWLQHERFLKTLQLTNVSGFSQLGRGHGPNNETKFRGQKAETLGRPTRLISKPKDVMVR